MSARRKNVMGQPCAHCGVILTPETAYVSQLGQAICRDRLREGKARYDAAHAEEPDDDDERPEIPLAPPEWERAELIARASVEDGGLYVGAVLLVLPGRFASAVEARVVADAFLSQLRSVPA